jgi:HD-GYP domain-containing protein (c-di-GMP phosphodiesterase class II)
MSMPSDVVVALGACRRAVQLYPPSHPAFKEALDSLEAAVSGVAMDEPFVLNVHQGRLYHGSTVISDEGAGVQSVSEALEERSIESLTFLPSLTRADVLGLVEVLSMRPGPDLNVGQELSERGVFGITVAFLAEASEVEDALEREERDQLREQDRALYNRLLASLRTVSRQLASGSGADLSQASGMVTTVLGRLLEDPSAMLALATIRGVGERTLFHSLNVMIYSLALGGRLGLPEESLPSLGTAALLHDVGKSAFDQDDPTQAERMRALHPKMGAEILQRVTLNDPAPLLAAYEHHMHVDGSGFPERPADYIAHPYSRMISVANRYENLTNPTETRAALTPDRAVLQVLRDAGSMLDPFFARLLASAMGVFPVGCLVRLSDQSIGVVERPGGDPLAPQIRLTFDTSGNELERPEHVDLSLGRTRIVEVIAQESVNIEASDKL